jgi:D-alanine transaminase
MELAMVRDSIVPLTQLDPVYLDRGTFFGDGVYEVVRSYRGRLFALTEHLERFERSQREIALRLTDTAELRRRIERAFAEAGLPEAAVYFHLTRGSAKREHTWPEGLEPSFFLTVTALPDTAGIKEKGVAVATHPDWRWKRCDIKSLNLLPNILAKQAANARGCFEALLVDEQGRITEGASSAVLAVVGDALVTRPLGPEILPSITRHFVLRLAERAGLTVVEKPFTPAEAVAADELLLAVTTKDVVPVVSVDGRPIADGRPGPRTRRLAAEFAELAGA